jgi:tRNA threonylcarbamoyladenosine biosynthesis protein TsaB
VGALRVLAFDTTTGKGSVAVVEDSEIRGEVRVTAPDAHSTRLLGAIDFLLNALGLGISAIDGLAVTIGPGSFTGLRVGIATAQGLSLGSSCRVAGIPTLDALAHRIRGAAPRLVALMDAYRDGITVGTYDRDARQIEEPQLMRPDELLASLPAGAAFIGEPALRYRAQIEQACPGAVFAQRSLFLAGSVGRLAMPVLAAGAGLAAEQLRPLYLREPHIGPARK